MTNFLRDLTAIPGPVSDLESVPGDADPLQYMDANKYNILRAASLDLRSWVLTGLTPGSYTTIDLTVDADGRITAVASGSSGVPTSRLISAGTGLSGGGSLAADRTISVATAGITNALLANMGTFTLKGNNTVGSAAPIDLNVAQVLSMLGLQIQAGYYGDGSDGDVVMDGVGAVAGCSLASGVYTATRLVFFHNLTINSGIVFKPDQYEWSVSGTCTGPGTIDTSGGDASGTTAGTGTQSGGGSRPLPVGGQGVAPGTPGTNVTGCPGVFDTTAAPGGAGNGAGAVGRAASGTAGGIGHGGGGGGGGNNQGIQGALGGGAGGTVAVVTPGTAGDIRTRVSALTGRTFAGTIYSMGSPGGGGADGFGGVGTGAGGASGAAGGYMVANVFLFSSVTPPVIRAKGGNGGNGTLSGAGGGGGAGGIVIYNTATPAGGRPTPNISGGTGGTGGPGNGGTGQPGGHGGNGGTGYTIIV